MRAVGQIGADGRSVLPQGVIDQAAQHHNYTPEQEAHIAAVLKNVLPETIKAKYKLEVMFTEQRSMHAPFAGVVAAWSNGGHFNGGGDETIYFCPVETAPGRTCGGVITGAFLGGSTALCEKCRTASKPIDLVGQFFARLTFQHWAMTLNNMFRLLGGDADLRVGLMSGDIRRATTELMQKDHGKALTKLREDRKWVVYPLQSIIRDTASGSDVEKRIRAFISA